MGNANNGVVGSVEVPIVDRRGDIDNPYSARWVKVDDEIGITSVEGRTGDWVRLVERSGKVRLMKLGECIGKVRETRVFASVWQGSRVIGRIDREQRQTVAGGARRRRRR